MEDRHIGFGQCLLKNQFPNINGFQSTLYQTESKYNINSEEALQVIHVAGAHWALISTLGCNDGEVNLYDSFYKTLGTDTDHRRTQIQ